jgi:D-3-phosphoglycerate dehydrogenase
MEVIMQTYNVLISDKLSSKCLAILTPENGFKVDVKVGLPKEELIKIIEPYHILLVRSATKVTRDVIEKAPNLKLIGRAGSGVDNIDLKAATEHKILVMNVPGGNTISAAEHTVAMMMAASRLIPQGTASIKAGKWEKSKFMGREITGKTLGVIGFGKIGQEVAKRALGLQMKVLATDPYVTADVMNSMNVKPSNLEEILKTSDVITFHAVLTAETKHLIGEKEISMMKNGAILLNVARGGIIDETALCMALEAGKFFAVALDVFEQEPPAPDLPVLRFENVIVTPHVGASTHEAQERVAVGIAEQVKDYMLNGRVLGVVNPELLK